MCECDECVNASHRWTTRQIREDVECRLAEVERPTVWEYIDIYINLIEPGHVDLGQRPCVYLDISRICSAYASLASTRPSTL